MITTKQATKIATTMTANLTNHEEQRAAAIVALKITTPETMTATDIKAIDAVVNAYRQLDPLADVPLPKATKKVAPAKKAAKAAPAKKSDNKPFPKPQGRTAVMFELVLAGKSNADGLAAILKKFPGSPTTVASLGWVRSQLRNNAVRWIGKHGVTAANVKTVKADKDCGAAAKK